MNPIATFIQPYIDSVCFMFTNIRYYRSCILNVFVFESLYVSELAQMKLGSGGGAPEQTKVKTSYSQRSFKYLFN